jgi:hypothetical protein|tara:strand:- start:13 stop:264 length:252 start_codon:yes stop_codon:yes gene_type:complete
VCERAEPSSNEHRATARSEAQPPEREDERNERQSNPRGADARTPGGSLGEDRRTGSECETEADEKRGEENSEHDSASKKNTTE